jgi:hypothetical protein
MDSHIQTHRRLSLPETSLTREKSVRLTRMFHVYTVDVIGSIPVGPTKSRSPVVPEITGTAGLLRSAGRAGRAGFRRGHARTFP